MPELTRAATTAAMAMPQDLLDAVRRDLDGLTGKYENDRQVQVQKDEAQDKLLEMQFDTMKRELGTYIRGKDLEDQKAFLLAKVSNIEIELRESIRSLGTSLRNEVSTDASRLHEQLDKIGQSVTAQIRLVDERLKANSESDSQFQEAMLSRLGRVEKELGLDEAGGGGGGLPARLAGLEEEVKDLAGRPLPGSPKAAAPGVVQEVQGEVDPELVKMLTDRLEALEEQMANMKPRQEKVEADVQEVKEMVEEVQRSTKLDWLEKRVKELADTRAGEKPDPKRMVSQINELTSRTMLLETFKEEHDAFHKEMEEKALQASLAPPPPKPKQREEEEESEEGSPHAGESTLNLDNPELSYVNLFQNMERLQMVVECMEESMPLEVRRSIAFFKGPKAKKRGKRSSSPGRPLELAAEVLGLKSESEEQAMRVQRMEEMLQNQQENLLRALRGSQTEQEQMKAKVEDLWRQFPQVSAILAPLQVSVTARPEGVIENTDGDAAGIKGLKVTATSSIEALKPLGGLIESSIQKSLGQLRDDLLQSLAEVKGDVGSKASANDLSLLKDRVERWARSPSPMRSPSLAGYKGRSPNASGEGWASQSREGGVARSKSSANCHCRCKETTDPCAQSTGKLPALNGTR